MDKVEKFRELLNDFGLHYHEFKSAEIENEIIKMYKEALNESI